MREGEDIKQEYVKTQRDRYGKMIAGFKPLNSYYI